MSAQDNIWDRRIKMLVDRSEILVKKTALAIRGGPIPPGMTRLTQAEQLNQYRQNVQHNPEAVAQMVATHGADEAVRYLKRMESLHQRDLVGYGPDLSDEEMGPRMKNLQALSAQAQQPTMNPEMPIDPSQQVM